MGHELNDVDISCSKHYTEKMAGINLTLQNRIITLVVICSILLISAVTVVQLNNRLEVSTDFNTYRTNLSGNIAKASLENTIRLAPSEAVVRHSKRISRDSANQISSLTQSFLIKTGLSLPQQTNRKSAVKCAPKI